MSILVRCSCGHIDIIDDNRYEYKHENFTACVFPKTSGAWHEFDWGSHHMRLTKE